MDCFIDLDVGGSEVDTSRPRRGRRVDTSDILTPQGRIEDTDDEHKKFYLPKSHFSFSSTH